ncbi:MAG: Wzz/FepE/Etk N-terminal domain-containing protein, partial [Pseudomonadota bacterium]
MNRFTPTEEGFEQAYRAPDRSGSADRQFIDFVSIVGIMWRGRWLIAACIVLTTAVGMFAIVETAPIYAAETKLMLDQRQRRITTGEEVVSSLQLN